MAMARSGSGLGMGRAGLGVEWSGEVIFSGGFECFFVGVCAGKALEKVSTERRRRRRMEEGTGVSFGGVVLLTWVSGQRKENGIFEWIMSRLQRPKFYYSQS